jgi:hypothetical protein
MTSVLGSSSMTPSVSYLDLFPNQLRERIPRLFPSTMQWGT